MIINYIYLLLYLYVYQFAYKLDLKAYCLFTYL